jgi:hypothetical protein
VDCTGFAAILIDKHFGIPFRGIQQYLFNDRALAVQVPHQSQDEPIASVTRSTAQRAGWVWDIALPTRRGIGYTYSSAHVSDEQAEQELHHYLAAEAGVRGEAPELRQIKFRSGHREKLWHRNCVAVGLSGGFVEPLEASALVMIEMSAKMLSEQLPANRDAMDIVAKRFNSKFLYHWYRIIEFLKLHYVLSKRTDSDYWRDNRETNSIPTDLQESLELWRYQGPWYQDLPQFDELFSSASYQYVLYGMDYVSEGPGTARRSDADNSSVANELFAANNQRTGQLVRALPSNRELLEKVREFGFQKI